MDKDIFQEIAAYYEKLEPHLLKVEGNVCKACSCNECCTVVARGGTHPVPKMELDYIRQYYQETGYPQGSVELFKEYLSGKKDDEGKFIHPICPFWSHETEGCSIYPARPLSCRLFGTYIGESLGSGRSVPERCYFRNIAQYIKKDANILEEIPLTKEFVELTAKYEKSRK